MKKIMTIFLFTVAGLICRAQEDDANILNQVSRDDQAAVDAIAMYPSDVRNEIFTAAMYPEIIVRLNTMQKKTNTAFSDLLTPYSKDEQEKIYNLTRYPGLITELAEGHPKSKAEIKAILTKYPDEIHEAALEEGEKNYDLLVQINQNNALYSQQFEAMIGNYPPDAVQAFRALIQIPEVLSTLTDNMQFTVVIGDVYKRNPSLVRQKTDSLNGALTQKNNQEATEWQQSIQNDPQAEQEYEQAAGEYAQENGYQPDEYNTARTPDVENYNTYSYNWWFGYPTWAPHAYWDPYPYWYDWGFYYGPHHHMVFIGMPSSYFLNWYFYNPEHHVRYAELSNHYYNYYYGHRGSVGYNNISRSVDAWHRRNADVIGKDWDKDPGRRVQLFKEYGQMETDRRKYNKENPEHTVKRTEFLDTHKDKYTNIRSLNTEPRKEGYSKPMPEPEPPVTKPRVKISESYNSREEEAKPARIEQPRPERTVSTPAPEHNYRQMNNAEDNHRNSWQQIQQAPVQHQNYQAPARTAPAPMRQSPAPSGGGGRRR